MTPGSASIFNKTADSTSSVSIRNSRTLKTEAPLLKPAGNRHERQLQSSDIHETFRTFSGHCFLLALPSLSFSLFRLFRARKVCIDTDAVLAIPHMLHSQMLHPSSTNVPSFSHGSPIGLLEDIRGEVVHSGGQIWTGTSSLGLRRDAWVVGLRWKPPVFLAGMLGRP